MRSVAALILLCAATAAGKPVALPTEYAGDRFYVTPVLASGTQLRCYTDSGGGGTFLFEDGAKTSSLKRTWHKGNDKRGTFASVAWPAFKPDATIPPPLEPPYFIVLPRGEFPTDIDCFLGQSWFGGQVWTFDYPGKTLWWRRDDEVPAHSQVHEVPINFKRNGSEVAWFPRIVVEIDGADVPLLFDTGATVTLSATALQAIGDGGPRVRAGSFITARTFDKWHKAHPGWRVLEGADEIERKKLRMIEVPAVTVGGYTVGPAWFAERPDANFDKFMSGFMAGHVEGALGGSALKSLRVTLDYARGVAVFEKP
jgi:hypothetical protein